MLGRTLYLKKFIHSVDIKWIGFQVIYKRITVDDALTPTESVVDNRALGTFPSFFFQSVRFLNSFFCEDRFDLHVV
jgi:hypothetical protein